MRRFLLLMTLLFSLFSSKAQVILNEIYTDPDVTPQVTNHEFFELYNTSRTTSLNLDCYSLVVYYDTRPNSTSNQGERGFYVLDFPNLSIEPLGYFIGAANEPTFWVQKCTNLTPDFSWNHLKDKHGNSGRLYNFKLNSQGTGYTVTGGGNQPFTTDDFFTSNKNGTTRDPGLADGFVYAVFLFNNGNYVNGFLGGANSQAISTVIQNMPPLKFSANSNYSASCSSNGTSQLIDWKHINRAENVTETPGSDNGYIRVRDGKCGEWVKSSSPQKQSDGTCTYTGHEHTPDKPNGGRVPRNDGFTITVQTSVCGTRIDFAITGVQDRGNLKAPDMFPFAVELYQDVNKDGMLDVGDQYLTTTSVTDSIYSAGPGFFEFDPVSSSNQYLLVFKSSLGCVEKIVPTDPLTFSASEKNFCGSQIDFTATANFDLTNDFKVDVYWDRNGDGQVSTFFDQLVISRTNVSSGVLDLPDGYSDKPLLIVYTTNYSSASPCRTIMRAVPAPVNTGITTAEIYICGDISGDIAHFDVKGLTGDTTGAGPVTVELYYDRGTLGQFDAADLFQRSKLDNGIINVSDTFKIVEKGAPIILVYRSARGCVVNVPLVQNCAPLPINLGSFSAVRNKLKVLLKWETLTEQGNHGFYVQRNVNGVWENRAFVFSAADGGNSNKSLEYSFNDDNNEKGVSQYRLQQVDIDGKATYSPIRSIRGEGQAARTIIYPNPSETGKVNVVFDGEGSRNVTVSDINGRIVRRYSSVVNSLVIDKLEVGMYLIQITDLSTAESSVEKVIIKKR